MKKFGLLEQDENKWWRITPLGKRVASGNRDAVEKAAKKNKILRVLLETFEGQDFSESVVKDQITDISATINRDRVTSRFMNIYDYLEDLEVEETESEKINMKPELFKITQLKCALAPPNDEEIANLASNVADSLESSEDASIRALARRMKENLENKDALTLLIDSITDILSEKYPSFDLEYPKGVEEDSEIEESEIKSEKEKKDSIELEESSKKEDELSEEE